MCIDPTLLIGLSPNTISSMSSDLHPYEQASELVAGYARSLAHSRPASERVELADAAGGFSLAWLLPTMTSLLLRALRATVTHAELRGRPRTLNFRWLV